MFKILTIQGKMLLIYLIIIKKNRSDAIYETKQSKANK